jgi:iron(III) transport system substrate-binding protein
MRKFCFGLVFGLAAGAAAAQGQVNVVCSVQAEWCNMMSTVYARTTGSVARGETAVSISFVHDGPGEKMQGFPVETVTPADGTGAEIGSMSIIRGARNLEAAKKFYEWALTPPAQEMAAAAKSFQLPSNKAAKVDPRVPDFRKIRFIAYDYAKYGASAERRRLIARWEKEVNALPR